jgi:hypothetical protein
MPVYGEKTAFGNLFVKVDVRTPEHLSEQAIAPFWETVILAEMAFLCCHVIPLKQSCLHCHLILPQKD